MAGCRSAHGGKVGSLNPLPMHSLIEINVEAEQFLLRLVGGHHVEAGMRRAGEVISMLAMMGVKFVLPALSTAMPSTIWSAPSLVNITSG
jgi:hypothetical protein